MTQKNTTASFHVIIIIIIIHPTVDGLQPEILLAVYNKKFVD